MHFNGDGEKCLEDFLEATLKFMSGLEETEISNTFFGHLLSCMNAGNYTIVLVIKPYAV